MKVASSGKKGTPIPPRRRSTKSPIYGEVAMRAVMALPL
jgi:hypothetical protein